MAQGAEFATTYLLGAPAPAYLCSGAPLKLDVAPTFEIAFAHLHSVLGLDMPQTWKWISTGVRPQTLPYGKQDSIVSVWETLTHGVSGP